MGEVKKCEHLTHCSCPGGKRETEEYIKAKEADNAK